MFCADHSYPHEDCPDCLATVAAMRPTVFAELAAAELCSGTESCRSCDYVYHEVLAQCPRCGEPHPFHAHIEAHREAARTPSISDSRSQPVADLSALTLRDLAGANLGGGPPHAGPHTGCRH